jgi:ATP-dependent Lhr-like helicase
MAKCTKEVLEPSAHPRAAIEVAAQASIGGALDVFHPAVRRWFEQNFEAPTRVQERGWEAIRSGEHTLIAAPTGSGKTLSAFLNAIDSLLQEGVSRGGELPDETRVLYVSPLKALGADIHRNLAEPRREIQRAARELGVEAPRITAAVRSGDTPSSRRQAMLRTPPHILVTTPESLYLLLTAEKSRAMLRTVRTVIVDEIHAVLESRRGSHLALTLERLEHVTGASVQRVGLSATQKPLEDVARFLVSASDEDRRPECRIVDEGHARELDLAVELPGSPLEAVLSGEVREEIYDRIAHLVRCHTTTIVFVNTRREAERGAHRLAERLGSDAVTAHHGSLSKEARLEAERRLKDGSLQALVATASLELGIDIGHVDLVCQLGSPRRIATLLQRVGRSGHTVHGTPRGRLFPMSREELVEGAALMRCVRRGELDRLRILEAPLDILAQQIVAEVACEEWNEEALFQRFRRAYPYRTLTRDVFHEIVEMVGRGFVTRNGRRGARIHYDAVHRRLRPRRGSRLAALTSGGAIPDNADYRVVLEPEGTFVGTVDEDFAVESFPGDIFQLGSTSWRILRVESGSVRVADAAGEPPTIPFWFGEAPARSPELSSAVAALRAEIEARIAAEDEVVPWLVEEAGISEAAAVQIHDYLAETHRLLGALPTCETLILERFFDEAGGMQLVLHSPFGSRVNRAWGLALRKRFCRQFNFELQAAATEEGILLSLGPQHSFPLEDVFRYLHPDSVEDILVQAVLDAPVFQTRWRWNASLSLAMLRWSGGHKVAPQIQRMRAEDLLVGIFPDAAACLETIVGDREVPDHPLVRQTLRDCLTEVMDLPRLKTVLERIHEGGFRLLARDTPEPSPQSHELLTARPYAFLDDAPLEERRAHAVYARRSLEPSAAGDLGVLDRSAIERVRREAQPEISGADELHDALLTFGCLSDGEIENVTGAQEWAASLARESRATRIGGRWVAAERISEAHLVWPRAAAVPDLAPPDGVPVPDDAGAARREIVRGRAALAGPTTVDALSESLGLAGEAVHASLVALEAEGVVLRGRFTPAAAGEEWCDRRLLARIHRHTIERMRAEIRPVSQSDFMQFLIRWQRAEPGHRVRGAEGVLSLIEQLEGLEMPGVAWETDVLPARCEDYTPDDLDALCMSGRVMWGRLSAPSGSGNGLKSTGPLRSSPIALWPRERAASWLRHVPEPSELALSTYAKAVYAALAEHGASFFQDVAASARLLPTQAERGLGELVAFGLVTSDSFSGLRALLTPVDRRNVPSRKRRRGRTAHYGMHSAGRWSLLTRMDAPEEDEAERWAELLLLRYGVVFRRLLAREPFSPPWRDLLRVLWRMEARGDVRGGRFVSGFSGEQFARSEALGLLRRMRKDANGRLVVFSAADPLNLTGVATPGRRIAAHAVNRLGYRDGVPELVLEGGEVRALTNGRDVSQEAAFAMRRRHVAPELRSFVT